MFVKALMARNFWRNLRGNLEFVKTLMVRNFGRNHGRNLKFVKTFIVMNFGSEEPLSSRQDPNTQNSLHRKVLLES